MALQRKLYFWLASFAGFVLFLLIFRDILLPFVAGMALAYLLDPIADFLEEKGMGRLWATLTILLLFLVVFVIAMLVAVPLIGSQLAAFVAYLPSLVESLQEMAKGLLGDHLAKLGIFENADTSSLSGLMGQAADWLGKLLQSIWNGGQALISVVSLMVVTPVVAFYLLLDWDRMITRIDSWLPRDHRQTIRDLVDEMDAVVAAFVRGQVLSCLILGVFYALGLVIIGLKFGLLIGLIAGLVSFIPYVGALVGFLLSIGVALVQFWPDYVMIGAVLLIFAAGQFLEGNILQPKLLGSSIGLHPVWLMFALFAFGSLLGFVGMLIAIPAAAVVGVLARFALKQYLKSSLYTGHTGLSKMEEQE